MYKYIDLRSSLRYPALSAELPMKWTNMKASGNRAWVLLAQLATRADFPQPEITEDSCIITFTHNLKDQRIHVSLHLHTTWKNRSFMYHYIYTQPERTEESCIITFTHNLKDQRIHVSLHYTQPERTEESCIITFILSRIHVLLQLHLQDICIIAVTQRMHVSSQLHHQDTWQSYNSFMLNT